MLLEILGGFYFKRPLNVSTDFSLQFNYSALTAGNMADGISVNFFASPPPYLNSIGSNVGIYGSYSNFVGFGIFIYSHIQVGWFGNSGGGTVGTGNALNGTVTIAQNNSQYFLGNVG